MLKVYVNYMPIVFMYFIILKLSYSPNYIRNPV
jgi:hypothetical protein